MANSLPCQLSVNGGTVRSELARTLFKTLLGRGAQPTAFFEAHGHNFRPAQEAIEALLEECYGLLLRRFPNHVVFLVVAKEQNRGGGGLVGFPCSRRD